MDGIGADADVTFVLTTDRADILETAAGAGNRESGPKAGSG